MELGITSHYLSKYNIYIKRKYVQVIHMKGQVCILFRPSEIRSLSPRSDYSAIFREDLIGQAGP